MLKNWMTVFIVLLCIMVLKISRNIPQALEMAYAELGFEIHDLMQISFFISRERIISTVGDGMAPWREKLFISMQRNTSPVSDFYQIPTNRVVELGSQIRDLNFNKKTSVYAGFFWRINQLKS